MLFLQKVQFWQFFIFKLQPFKNTKMTVLVKSAILAIFYFAPGGFQCIVKGIFVPKDLKSGEISKKIAL